VIRSWLRFASAVLLAVALGLVVLPARAVIIERVVAVVGERPILFSELRRRARPFLSRILASTQQQAQVAAQESEMYKELLNRMIDDRLEEQAADKAHISVTPDEVDAALRNVAGQAKIPIRDLLVEARRQGLTEQDYRDEIRRQVLEGKLIQLRVRGRVRVTDQDARAAYDHWIKEMQAEHPVDVRMIAMRLPQGAPPAVVEARVKLAQQVVARARGGEDFCSLVQQFSDDTKNAQNCGSTGPQPLEALKGPIEDAIRDLKDGEVSDPVRYGNEAILVIKLVGQPQVPPFEKVKESMADRAFGEAMERQRKLWLGELRRGVYVDSRL
jgi:peptidyl-prolyl cis-trans isomerase SurA